MPIFRTNSFKSIVALMLCLSALSARECLAVPLEDLKWNEFRSENFVVYSSVDTGKTIELLKYMELLHALVPELTTIDTSLNPVPTRIVFVEKKSGLRQLGISAKYGGEFLEGLRNNFIVVRDSRFSYLNEAIYYHYIKYLLNSSSSTPIPTWISEGFAQYLRTLVLEGHGSRVVIGRLSKLTKRGSTACGWNSATDLINDVVLSSCKLGVRASTVVRQLIQDPEMRENLHDYLSRLSKGEDKLDAFASGFNLDPGEFNSDTEKYSKKRGLSTQAMDVGALINDFEPTSHRMDRTEAALVLGRVALRKRQLDNARNWLTIAATALPQRASALSALGVVNLFEGDLDDAERVSTEAIELDPENTGVLLNEAKIWLRRAYDEADVQKRDQHLIRARVYIGKAWNLNDTEPETYAMYGRSFLLQQNFEKALDSLEAANRLLPSHTGTVLDLAQTYQRLNRQIDAENHFDAVVRWGHLETHKIIYVYPAKFPTKWRPGDDSWMLRKQDEIAPYKQSYKLYDSMDFWY